VFNHRLSAVIATMGHGDMLVVADAGLPIPPGVERIDLAVRAGLPGVIEVTEAIAGELQVERIVLAAELESGNGPLSDRFAALFPGVARKAVPHEEFKRLTAGARAVVRTGECTPYANVILVSGVTF
jgi:D-ribose pyranase